MEGLDCLGTDDDEIGFDYGGLLQAAGGVAQYGVSAYETEKKEKDTKAAEEQKLKTAIAADQAAANAVAKADFSAVTKGASAGIDAQAAQMALAAQDRASLAGLSAESQKKRVEEAERTMAAVVKAAQSAPKDLYKAALVKAWTQVINKAQAGAIMASGSGLQALGAYQESWFTRPVVGKLPGWGVLTIGAGVATIAALVVKKLFFKVPA